MRSVIALSDVELENPRDKVRGMQASQSSCLPKISFVLEIKAYLN